MKNRFQSLVMLILGVAALTASADRPSTALKVGDRVPDVAAKREDGGEVRLRALVTERPAVLVFYRGSWCPYCMRQLQGLAGVQKELKAAGVDLYAISVDQPSKVAATPKKDDFGFTLLSDSEATVAQAFGIAFKVEDSLVSKYKNDYRIDLEAAAGGTHHLLPHPAVYVVDRKGEIRFSHVDTDYRVRLEPGKVVEAARAAGGK